MISVVSFISEEISDLALVSWISGIDSQLGFGEEEVAMLPIPSTLCSVLAICNHS